jgi:hypothetical protein
MEEIYEPTPTPTPTPIPLEIIELNNRPTED